MSAYLAVLQTRLAQREWDIATLRAELHAFDERYVRIVGVKFAEIDDLEAQIAEARNGRNPRGWTAHPREADAGAKAADPAGAAGAVEERERVVGLKPTERLKSLYRQIAKRVHPDLATDHDERARRNQVMAEVNRASAAGDEPRLRAILNEWETSPESVTGDGIGAELVRTIRRIHQVEERLACIETEIDTLNGSDLSQLKARADSARMAGRDLLAGLAVQLDEQVVHLRRTRNGLRSNAASS